MEVTSITWATTPSAASSEAAATASGTTAPEATRFTVGPAASAPSTRR